MRLLLIAVAIIATLVTGVHFGWEAIMETTSPFYDFWNPMGRMLATIIGGLAGIILFGYVSAQAWMMMLFGRTFRDNTNAPPEYYKNIFTGAREDERETKQIWGLALGAGTAFFGLLLLAAPLKVIVFAATAWVAFVLISCVRRRLA